MKARNILITGALLSLLNGHLNAQQKTYLKPFTFRGDLEYLMTAWSTGTTLNGNPPIIFGPVETVGNAAYHQDKLDSLFGTYFLGVNNIDRIIKEFKKTNPRLKEDKLREYIKDKIPSLESRGLFKRLFFDGKLTKEELKLLEDGVYGYWYMAENDSASLPGILELQYQARKAERELLEEKVDTTKVEKAKPDASKEKEYGELPKEKPLTPEEEKRVKERLKYDIGLGYDSDGFFSLEFRYGDNFRVGPSIGYRSKEEHSEVTPVINNFYGRGNRIIDRYFLGLSAGIDLSKYVALNAGLALKFRDEEKSVAILRDTGELTRPPKTKDYRNNELRTYLGPEFRFKNLSLVPKVGYNFGHKDEKFYGGLLARLRF